MKRIFIVLMFLFLVSSVNAYHLTDSETKNNFTVNWYLSKQGISKVIYDIEITNLINVKRKINLSSVFMGINYPSSNIKDVSLLEYEEKQDANTGVIKYIWSKSKPIFQVSNKNKKKNDYGLINIGKFETKWFRLILNLPVSYDGNKYSTETKIFLELDNFEYHPWYNVTWFYRSYLWNFTSVNVTHTKRISYNTRLHSIENVIKNDCLDIRITDIDNNELDYYLVTGCLTDNTTIDIQFTTNLTSIYLYYGNENAENVSNVSVAYNDSNVSVTGSNITYNYSERGSYISTWNVDERNATYILDLNNTNNYDGLVVGLSNTSGMIGDGLYTNGTSDNYIAISKSLNLSGSSEITMMTWINTNEISAHGWIFDSGTDAVDVALHNEIRRYGDEIQCKISNSTAGVAVTTTDFNLIVNTWYHVACTYDGVTIKIYKDGVVSVNTSTHDGTLHDFDRPIIGQRWHIGSLSAGNEFNGTLDEIRIYERALNSTEIFDEYNGSYMFNESQINATNTTSSDESYPNYSIEYQQFSPLYASEEKFEGVWVLNYSSPIDTSIYDLKISLDSCNFNEFELDTNTFKIYGNVTKSFYISKKWNMCLEDKFNVSKLCQIVYSHTDAGKSNLRYGYSNIIPEYITIRLASGNDARITEPNEYGYKDIDKFIKNDFWYLVYPKEFTFESSCVDNDIVIKYYSDESLKETPADTKPRGLSGALNSFMGAIVGFLVITWDIVFFVFSLLIFAITNIWLIFILFEMFAMIYALQSTETISEYVATYIKAHVEGIKFLITVLEWIFDHIMRIVNAIIPL